MNPFAVARYRDRHQLSGAKSDAADARVLADLVRTDRHNHADGRRQLRGGSDQGPGPGTSELDLGPNRHTNALRSALREYYPGALEAFEDSPTATHWRCWAGRRLPSRPPG